ncbi:MAG: HAMP domain-containing protein [Candidatus Latescibacterota bacterium]|nr:MAG: HAMP domain-containing protein [Candidatus Latescibacterota bacterium]
MARQLPLLFVLFVGLLFWLENHLEDAFYATNLESVESLSQMVVSRVQTSMESKDAGRPWEGVERLLPADKNTRLKIINKQGVVLFSSEPESRGQKHNLTDPPCVPCHVGGSVRATVRSKFIDKPLDEPFTLFVAPLRNTEECRSCHTDEGTILGMVYVWHSLGPVRRLVRTSQIAVIIAGAAALIFTILTTRLFLSRYLNRPLNRLVAGARAIGSGDLNQKIQLSERTELSVLADAFNKSGERLKESIREIKNHRDDLQNLYYIADQLGRSVQPEERRRRAVELIRSIFKSDCLIIAGHFHPESRIFHGTVTYRENDEIIERSISSERDLPAVPFCSPLIVQRWLRGELDQDFRIREGSTVAFPLERHGQRLGIILAPARRKEDSPDGRATAANPEVVRAFIKHLSIALELSELQRERLRQERLAAIGEALAGLAHCLRNTLSGLRGGEYIVESAMRNEDENRLEKGWGILKNGVRHVEKLTLDILFYTSDRQPELELINPNQIVQQVVDLLGGSAKNKGVTLRCELDDSIKPLPIDRVAVYQAFLNLVGNAIDACVESELGDLVVIASRDRRDDLLFTIEDNGVGMEEQTLKRVFDRFYTNKPSKGTGLGLPVVKKIAEAHGGKIEVKSTLGKGTVFYLTLPKNPRAS